MNLSSNIAETLARAQQYWTTRPEPAAANRVPFTIAVSREVGTFGAAIARMVGDRLGWQVYDSELMQRIADDIGVRRSLLESVDERQPGWLNECFNTLFAVPQVNQTVYFRRLVETILSLGSHGNCVIVGRGATNVLPTATTLRVRIVAPLEQRIQAVQRQEGVSRHEAAERIETKERERNQFVAAHFHMDPTNPTNYDLVLNVERFSNNECAELILQALNRLRNRGVEGTPSVATPTLASA